MADLIERARVAGTPLTEGDRATFVWEGERAPDVIGDFTTWDRLGTPLRLQPAGPGAWAATVRLPPDAYLEYAFVRDGERFPDPLNPRQVDDGLGHGNSWFWMPEGQDTPLVEPQAGVPAGQVTAHEAPTRGHVIGEARTVYLYQPPVAEPSPLIVVLDGQDYLHKARLNTLVDNLIAAGRIQPVALALVANGGAARLVEYACSDATLAFLTDVVVPLAQAHLRLTDTTGTPGAYGMLGASMGGLMSLYAGLRAPEVFGHVLAESGAFGAHVPVYRLYYRSVIEDLIDLGPVQPLKLWLDCGLHEWFLEPNRRMAARLRARGYDLAYHEQPSGHNYVSWRNVVWRGLEYLYGAGED
jgi:enterochelin esterase family protein